MSESIRHIQTDKNASTSECHMCGHRRVCRILAVIEALDIPHPFTVEFECEFYR